MAKEDVNALDICFSRLPYQLFGKNEEFRKIHEYYTNRAGDSLKKMQSLIVVGGCYG